MSKRNNSVARGTSYLLIYLTAIQPLHPAIAAGITPDNNHTQVQNQGNVPVVNIATPNNAGISHNTYKEFNVATQGAVLNNATQAAKSQLAGQLNANPNLHGKAAELIINEVTGSGRSNLQGQLEIFGNKANVMIANPNGITCDGCGFINTSSAMLTTGKPQFDKQGALEALKVTKGQIIIGSKGLDGKATDYVDIISRATELNGKIQANNLSLTQGANRISLKDGTVKPIAGEGAKPQLAIDTKALGGMYANKIRLVATEEGVGVNLKELTSNQRDITLNANGKIELGNTQAKTDLNIVGKETHIAPNIKVQAGRDITLENTTLDNKGNVTAGRDMRIFGDTVKNTGNKALLQANDNMWIQKDAQGNKGKLVENRSATIKTVKGDLVIRTKELNNVRSIYYFERRETAPNPTDKNFNILKAQHESGYNLKSMQPSALMSGGNIYVNSDILSNQPLSKIEARKDIFLTGKIFSNTGRISEDTSGLLNLFEYFPKDTYVSITDSFNIPTGIYQLSSNGIFGNIETYHQWDDKNYHILPNGEVKYDIRKDKLVAERASIIAKGNLIADFSDSINIDTNYPYSTPTSLSLFNYPVDSEKLPEIMSAKNILLHAGKITLKDKIKAANDLNIVSESDIILKNSILLSQNNLSMTAVNNINLQRSNIKGKDVAAISRNGDIEFHNGDQLGYIWDQHNTGEHPASNQLSATGNLTINSGKNLLLQNVYLQPSKNISLTANNDITIENHANTYIFAKSKVRNMHLPIAGILNATESLTINAGGHLSAKGSDMFAGKDIYLSAAKHIDLSSPELGYIGYLFLPKESAELSSRITAKNNISIMSGGDINGKAVQIQANGNTLLSAGNNITLSSLAYSAINKADDNNKDDRHITAQIRGDKKLTIAANGAITTAGSKLTSGGDVILSSGGNMRFESVQNHTYRENGSESTESVTQNGTELTSGGILTVISNGSILFQATKLASKGAMDIAAKGGYLYAQAMEESSRYEKTETKRRWYGKKKTTTRTRHDVTNKVTEFTAGGDINLLSRDDSTYEASKIATNKNAKLTSTHGKVNFKAVKNSTFEQTITHSKGFYIKQTDKGYTENKWVLPAIHIGGKFTVEAAKGVSADIKAQNGQALQNVVSVFGNTPETAWLKGLSERKDVQWNLVKDAYDSWNYKSQHLNPVVSAVIAIAVAAATAGAGLTVSVAGSAASTAGSAATAAGATASTAAAMSSVAYGATASGMAALASQAAVALVDNQGDLSKTLKVMGSSDTVKSTLTSMAIGGALAGFDNVMGWDKAANGTQINPAKATLPKLSNGDWSKVAQRVAGQSIISSSLGTAINGGSFKDNFTTALLANIGSQINAEGAGLIGKNGQVLSLPGKAISHAVVSALAAEIGGGDAKGAAAGALAAELAAITLDKTFNDPMKIQAGGKIIGSVAGAIATNSAKGANSGANAGEIVILFNHLNSMNAYNLARELQEAHKQGTPTEAIWNKYNKLSAAQRAEMLSACAGNGGLCTLTYQAEMEGGIKTADAISGLRWIFNLSAEDAHRISQFVTTENQNDLGLLYNSLPAWEKGALIAKEAVESAGIGGAIGGKASVASIVGKRRGSAIPVPEPIVASNGLTYKSNPKHTLGQQGNRPNAGIEPKDSVDLFSHSISSTSKEKQRYSVDPEKNVHRFSYSNDGTWHWSGSTGDQKNPLDRQEIPNDVKKNFGLPGKWR
ncbi:DUF637 domain-containing protein [Photorhabdus kleinii]|uniref:DUF637 domain-containing protein n=1 Tax=Photorhabdus kleinii TaxID=768034 RepID=UPI0021D51AFB|nr:DUF637 domain-containing protein [Photorhabdus kleinii]MCT8343782.1 DUF637 domain-containing protein [Photorhabdus kleinii]